MYVTHHRIGIHARFESGGRAILSTRARSAFHTAWTSSSCLLALTASWYSGRWSKVQPGPKFFLRQVRASMPGWSAQEAREGGTPVGLGTFTHEVGMRSHEGSYASPRGTTIHRELAGCNITFRPQIWTTSFFFVTSSASETPYFVYSQSYQIASNQDDIDKSLDLTGLKSVLQNKSNRVLAHFLSKSGRNPECPDGMGG